MTELIPVVPRGWKVVGCLCDAEHPELLNGTMVELSHPSSDILIYAGWEPEEDPTGQYSIGVARGCEAIGDEQFAGDLATAAQMLFQLAERFQPDTIVPSHVRFADSVRNPFVCASGIYPTIPVTVHWPSRANSCLVYS